jgi:transposase InsO family protein
MRTIQFLLKQGVLAKSQQMRQLHSRIKNIPSHNLPKCAACQFGRQTNRAVPGKTTTVNRARKGITSADKLHPGDLVFIDHFTCSTRGRKNEGAGLTRGAARRSNDHSYKGGCIFVDAGTGYISIKFQSYLTAEETINAVSAYKREAYDHGIIIKSYQSDNGSQFTSKAFKEHIAHNRQSNRYASAGSHHQNGKAERAIRTIMAMARTMLLHSSIHWPEMSEPTLWPQAVKHAVWIYNHVPSPENGLMSVDLWTKTRYPIQKFHNLHVFGCPVYVLEKNLADGKSLGRWKARSNRCLYLGLSMQHSAEAALVLNPNTGRITPQWNVVFDDEFATVATDPEEMPDYSHEEWSRMFNTHTCHFRNNEEPSYAETTTNEEEAFEPPAPLFEEVAPGRPPTGTNRQPT